MTNFPSHCSVTYFINLHEPFTMRFQSGGSVCKAAVSLSATFAPSDGKNKLIFKIEMLTHFSLSLSNKKSLGESILNAHSFHNKRQILKISCLLFSTNNETSSWHTYKCVHSIFHSLKSSAFRCDAKRQFLNRCSYGIIIIMFVQCVIRQNKKKILCITRNYV